MKLIAGLGNPGIKYEKTRHNSGFMALDLITNEINSQSWQNKFQSLINFQTIEAKKVVFLKPLTYMNLSGIAVQEVLNFYKIKIEDVIIVHDDIDISLGKIKLKEGGGHAGHNGLRSIHEKIGPGFLRVRIGVSRPQGSAVSNYVLSEFSNDEIILLKQALSKFSLGINYLIKNANECCQKLFSTS
jgi:PTH1 family peptidyl-tRNA hydrolase